MRKKLDSGSGFCNTFIYIRGKNTDTWRVLLWAAPRFTKNSNYCLFSHSPVIYLPSLPSTIIFDNLWPLCLLIGKAGTNFWKLLQNFRKRLGSLIGCICDLPSRAALSKGAEDTNVWDRISLQLALWGMQVSSVPVQGLLSVTAL